MSNKKDYQLFNRILKIFLNKTQYNHKILKLDKNRINYNIVKQ